MSDQRMRRTGFLTVDELRAAANSGDITAVVLAVPDMMGRLKGKRFGAPAFLEKLQSGAEMCGYILATDVGMTPLDGFALTGWTDGFGDIGAIPDTGTIRRLPHWPGTALVHADAIHPGGGPIEVAPRQMLRAQLDRLAELGLEVKVGLESEFVLYRGTPQDAHAAGYRHLEPVGIHNHDYGLDFPADLRYFIGDLEAALRGAGTRVEAVKGEGAPGQMEVTFPYGPALPACDGYTVYKHAVRHLAERRDMTPTFMAAPQTGVGSGLHLHVSLWRNDKTVFATQSHDELPELLERSLAGLIAGLPDMAPLYAPTPNSYKRYQPYSFAPTNFSWGWDNRSCAVRVVGHQTGTHLEVRMAGADANPYLVLAAIIAAIIHGISDRPKLPEPCTGDAYEEQDVPRVPRTLDEAVVGFRQSRTVRDAFGLPVLDHYMRAAGAEIAALAEQVTDVERKRGFDRA
ncbi:glutamine synthetase family protein [Streptomyces sp. BV286]|uniref:glutamine synthetase family protein n=1 Tax=Streptomyces sp. BV286 TaxID=2849672 RepID=UPI001C2E2541|nr:glutamine synthetase family protein [Streptomyces sp. BV286]MBV1940870.1 glutamine synthetase family protein [Streptomyces sp. BV286]